MRKWGGRTAERLVRATLARYGTVCHLCDEDGATSADHVIPRSRGGADTVDNLRPVHIACNQRRGDRTLDEYRARYGRKRQGVTVRVVCGPPAGGKSTYIATHAEVDDIVIDLDALANALRPNPVASHSYPRHVKAVAMAARLGAIREAAKLRRPVTVWLINTLPSPAQIATYAADGWELITIDPGRDVARARAASSDRRDVVLRDIDHWYSHRPTTPRPASVTPAARSDAPLAPSRPWLDEGFLNEPP